MRTVMLSVATILSLLFASEANAGNRYPVVAAYYAPAVPVVAPAVVYARRPVFRPYGPALIVPAVAPVVVARPIVYDAPVSAYYAPAYAPAPVQAYYAPAYYPPTAVYRPIYYPAY